MPVRSFDPARFEADRLRMFAAHGFVANSQWVRDEDGRETYLAVGGTGSPTRILVHGGMSEAGGWALLAGRLNGRLAIADRPGHGLSYDIDYRRVDDYFEAATLWIQSIADGIGETEVDLIGSSMGGFFTTAFAVKHPHRVRRLVLVAAPAGIDRSLPIFPRLAANAITGRLLFRSTFDSPEQLRERAYRSLVAHPDRVPDDQLDVEFQAGLRPGFGLMAHTMFRAVTSVRGWPSRYLIKERLINLEIPTLIAWGEQDTNAYPPSLGQEIAAKMKDAEFVLLPDAGHAPWIDQPDLTAEAINSFLDRPQVAAL